MKVEFNNIVVKCIKGTLTPLETCIKLKVLKNRDFKLLKLNAQRHPDFGKLVDICEHVVFDHEHPDAIKFEKIKATL